MIFNTTPMGLAPVEGCTALMSIVKSIIPTISSMMAAPKIPIP